MLIVVNFPVYAFTGVQAAHCKDFLETSLKGCYLFGIALTAQ